MPVLPGAHALFDCSREESFIESRDRADQLLLQERREVELVEIEGAEASLIFAHQAMYECRSTPRMADDEYGTSNLDFEQSREQQAVEEEAE